MSNNYHNYHKTNGPAWFAGWFLRNTWHRYYGPALTGPKPAWYIHGRKVRDGE